MAEILSFTERYEARRRRRENVEQARCVEIVELNLRLALYHFHNGPDAERRVRARQVRQLSEMLEYLVSMGT